MKEAFEEIVEWRKDGVLKVGGIVRNIHDTYIKQGVTYPFHMMENPILLKFQKEVTLKNRYGVIEWVV